MRVGRRRGQLCDEIERDGKLALFLEDKFVDRPFVFGRQSQTIVCVRWDLADGGLPGKDRDFCIGLGHDRGTSKLKANGFTIGLHVAFQTGVDQFYRSRRCTTAAERNFDLATGCTLKAIGSVC